MPGKWRGSRGGSGFHLFGRNSDEKRNAFAAKALHDALALQALGDLPQGKEALEQYVQKALKEYDDLQDWLGG